MRIGGTKDKSNRNKKEEQYLTRSVKRMLGN